MGGQDAPKNALTKQSTEHSQDKDGVLTKDETPSRTSSTSTRQDEEQHTTEDATRVLTRTSSRPYTPSRLDTERNLELAKTKSIVLAPTRTADGHILVEWYTTDDVANPQNWGRWKKSMALLLLCLYSFAAYGASSMYVSGEEGIMEEFHVGATPAALGLAICKSTLRYQVIFQHQNDCEYGHESGLYP